MAQRGSQTKSILLREAQAVAITESEFVEKNGNQSGKTAPEVRKVKLHVGTSEKSNVIPGTPPHPAKESGKLE